MPRYGGYLFSLYVRVVSGGQRDTERLAGLPPDLCILQVIALAQSQKERRGEERTLGEEHGAKLKCKLSFNPCVNTASAIN